MGTRHSERINTMVSDIISASWKTTLAEFDSAGQDEVDYSRRQDYIREMAEENVPLVRMSDPALEAVDTLREYLFQIVYQADEEAAKAKRIVKSLYRHFCEHTQLLPDELAVRLGRDSTELVVCDYVSGMTDRYALRVFESIALPRYWRDLG